jgi:hypothetical protein
VIDCRSGDCAQHSIRHICRTGNLEEMSSGRRRHKTEILCPQGTLIIYGVMVITAMAP